MFKIIKYDDTNLFFICKDNLMPINDKIKITNELKNKINENIKRKYHNKHSEYLL